MLVHDLSCAPVWDSIKRKYVGLLSVSDFLDILMSSYAAEDKDMFVNLSNARICDWAGQKKKNTSTRKKERERKSKRGRGRMRISVRGRIFAQSAHRF